MSAAPEGSGTASPACLLQQKDVVGHGGAHQLFGLLAGITRGDHARQVRGVRRVSGLVGTLEDHYVAPHPALPMRLQDRVLGTLGLFGTEVGPLEDDDVVLGQALAHVATVALVSTRAATDQSVVTEQLQQALSSRVLIEQSKGLLAQVGNIEVQQALTALQRYARDNNERLSEAARRVVTRELSGRQVLDHALAKGLWAASATERALPNAARGLS